MADLRGHPGGLTPRERGEVEVDGFPLLARSRPARTARAAVGLLLLGLVACSVVEEADAPTTASGAPLDGLTATLYQTRMDVAAGQLEVRLHNGTGADLTLRGVQLVSTAFDEPLRYAKEGSLITAGRVVDLPVPLGQPVCDGRPAVHTVELDYRLDDGRTGTTQVPAADETGQVAAVHSSLCFAARARKVAALSIPGPPTVRDVEGERVADLTVDVRPAGAGDLVIERVGDTTLLQVVDPATGERLPEGYAVNLSLSGTAAAPTSFTVTVAPARCDAHAIAEDKQGTLFPVSVRLDGEDGRVSVASPAEVTNALYGFVREACGS